MLERVSAQTGATTKASLAEVPSECSASLERPSGAPHTGFKLALTTSLSLRQSPSLMRSHGSLFPFLSLLVRLRAAMTRTHSRPRGAASGSEGTAFLLLPFLRFSLSPFGRPDKRCRGVGRVCFAEGVAALSGSWLLLAPVLEAVGVNTCEADCCESLDEALLLLGVMAIAGAWSICLPLLACMQGSLG